MVKKISKILFLATLLLFSVTIFVNEADAEACANRDLIGNRDIFWGNPPAIDINSISPRDYPDASANAGEIVRLSLEGEFPGTQNNSSDCTGFTVDFLIYRSSDLALIRQISGSLSAGSQIGIGNFGTWQWYIDWPNDLFDGTYVFRVYRINGVLYNSILSTNTLTITGAGPPPPLPSCNANFSPGLITQGQSTVLTWNSTDDTDGTVQYSCTGNIGSGGTIADGSVSVNPNTSQTCTFAVANAGGTTTCSASVTVTAPPPPVVSITCNGFQNQCNIPYGGSAVIDWVGTNVNSCTVSPSVWFGTFGSQNTGQLTSSQTYSVSCLGQSGTTSDSVQVIVAPAPAASCNTSFSPASITTGGATTQSWTSSNDADGTLSYSCTGNIGSGSVAANSSKIVSPSSSQTCTFTAVNASGTSSTCSSSIAVNAPPPPPPPSCDMNPVCSGSCSASSNTCSVNNGIQNNCVYTAYSGGGNCNQVSSPNQPCTINTCLSGYACTNGTCLAPPPPPPPPPPPAPQSNFFGLEISNPFGGQLDTFDKLFDNITIFLYYLAAPIVVIMIIIAGIFFLIGRGEPDKVKTAKNILTYALIGLVIILIGRGFIALLESIFALGG